MEEAKPADGVLSDTRDIVRTGEATEEDISVFYTLWRGGYGEDIRYSLQISCGQACVVLTDITHDSALANRIFEIYRHGTITPSAAYEIYEELMTPDRNGK